MAENPSARAYVGPYMLTSDAAAILHYEPESLLRLARNGDIPKDLYWKTPTGRYRWYRDRVENFHKRGA